ncbi:MFS transporter [Planctobacterium marinum]|uniref:MFS transporter n=1 Tax=Planctobacterium marinum TaxID=1631968 RepID=UPI001E6064D4|nr:MFS transporter [Planctobacterium marinum]MCC2605150.1 MFS transporter [Planctobacterium marinum]
MRFPPVVWLLAAIAALSTTSGTLMVLVAGIFGAQVAPAQQYATLPLALMILGTAFSVSPIALLMRKLGRKKVFMMAAVMGIAASLVAANAVKQASFVQFCLASAMLGCAIAGFQQIRFAAIEWVSLDRVPKVVSLVLLGGLVAAILGPELSVLGQGLTPGSFQGTFYLLACIQVCCFILFLFYQPKKTEELQQSRAHASQTAGNKRFLRNPGFVVAVLSASLGYGLMAFIMTATPVHMHVFEHHSLADTKVVIQSHIVAMFLPSFFSGWLIGKIGELKLILTGIVMFGLCILAGFFAVGYWHYWVTLVLLGIAWNFLFTAGTSLLPKAYLPEERFQAQALNDGVMFAIQAAASLSAGAVLYFLGWQAMIIVCLFTLLLLLAIILINKEHIPK